jgi:hypothetical protein
LLVYNPIYRAAPGDLANHPYLCFIEEQDNIKPAGVNSSGSSRPVGEMVESTVSVTAASIAVHQSQDSALNTSTAVSNTSLNTSSEAYNVR